MLVRGRDHDESTDSSRRLGMTVGGGARWRHCRPHLPGSPTRHRGVRAYGEGLSTHKTVADAASEALAQAWGTRGEKVIASPAARS